MQKTVLAWLGVALFAALGLFLIAFGVLYASVNDMLFFHAAAVPEAARHDVKPLYLALMKLIGGASIGLGLLGLYVTFGPLRTGARWAAGAVAVAYAVPIVMAAYVAETLAEITGAPTSWHIMGALLVVIGLALVAHIAAARGR
jgi:uncharacterized membrane protein YhdT